MRNVLAIACVRMGSTRLPGKALATIGTLSTLAAVLARLEQSETIRRVVVATPASNDNEPLWEIAREFNATVFTGSEDDVVGRMAKAARVAREDGDYILRVLTDQPLLDWQALDMNVRLMQNNSWDFVRPLSFNEDPVYGAGITPWSYRCWHAIAENSKRREQEHPGMWLYKNMRRWDYGLVDYPHWMYRPYRFELDTEADLELMNRLYAAWGAFGKPAKGPIPLKWAVQYMDNNPGLQNVNAHIREKTGPYTSFTKAEISAWVRDYAEREIVWSEVGLKGSIRGNSGRAFKCKSCSGQLMVLSLLRGKLKLKCVRCGEDDTFYGSKR